MSISRIVALARVVNPLNKRFVLKSIKYISIVKMNSYPTFDQTPRVLSIQSHVVHGYVGNKSAIFPLQVLGFEVDSINTVQYATHTAYKHIRGNVLQLEEMKELLEGLTLNDVDYYTHFLTGYSRSPESLKMVAEIIKKLRQKNPNVIYVCDPVMGDNGQMYVPKEVLPVYRDIVVPLADILTPNQFEAELLTGLKVKDLQSALDVVQALHAKGIKTVVLSSTELGDEKNMIGIASSKGGPCYTISIPRVAASYTGTGDLFAALLLAWCHRNKNNLQKAIENTIATMQTIVHDTYRHARVIQPSGNIPPALLELRLVQNRTSIENPQVKLRAMEVTRTDIRLTSVVPIRRSGSDDALVEGETKLAKVSVDYEPSREFRSYKRIPVRRPRCVLDDSDDDITECLDLIERLEAPKDGSSNNNTDPSTIVAHTRRRLRGRRRRRHKIMPRAYTRYMHVPGTADPIQIDAQGGLV